MDRERIQEKILAIFEEQFEIVKPGLHEDLREVHGFDSIDAIELLREIEILLDATLSQDEKKSAMDIRTISHIVDYVEGLASAKDLSAAN